MTREEKLMLVYALEKAQKSFINRIIRELSDVKITESIGLVIAKINIDLKELIEEATLKLYEPT